MMKILEPLRWMELAHVKAIQLTRLQKRLILIPADVALVVMSFWAAAALRLGVAWPSQVWTSNRWLPAALALVGVGIFFTMGLYRAVLRSMGRHEILLTAKSCALLAVLLAAFGYFDSTLFLPRSTPIIFALVLIGSMVALRGGMRSYYHWLKERGAAKRPVLIYGAGESGTQLCAALHSAKEFEPVAFLDDDWSLTGSLIAGRRVYHPTSIDMLLTKFNVSTVLLALPSISRARRKEVLQFLAERPVNVQTIPSMVELVSGVKSIDKLQTVGLEELIGRDAVDPDKTLFTSVYKKSVLITGAGGSIGSELARQVSLLEPKELVLLDNSEFSLYSIEQEISGQNFAAGLPCHFLLGSVCDERRMAEIVRNFQIQTIFHAAAYKHVPLVEANPFEGIRNNTFGSAIVASVATQAGVERVILISTDKAVRPTNVMGASKRVAEIVFQQAQEKTEDTIFSMVRFGNVMGSSGSVIPLFRKQIEAGGPVTVTHRDIIRYFMTIPEAAQLVIQAGSISQGGDVFLLDMGAPVTIFDLAKKMIRLSNLEVKDDEHPDGDIEIIFTGLRPGEKLFEELLVDGTSFPTAHPKIMRSLDLYPNSMQFDAALAELRAAVDRSDLMATSGILQRLVEGYSTQISSEFISPNAMGRVN